jgi:hypothetical protein
VAGASRRERVRFPDALADLDVPLQPHNVSRPPNFLPSIFAV